MGDATQSPHVGQGGVDVVQGHGRWLLEDAAFTTSVGAHCCRVVGQQTVVDILRKEEAGLGR